ncbi:Levanase [Candidatus Koribacter versatilis Ellin345]|uniref:Levanase n=2 Tax=Candidatus Korobacter versatilis TaxID=658062 RepID=Q1IJR4_KORVE|nr:Levanase [Candidatus Koribacter versatilis Ellin345]
MLASVWRSGFRNAILIDSSPMRHVLALLALIAVALPALPQYDQPYRPQVHFSPREHWTNDPNGLVFFDGEYHLFFQYNPFGDVWGHMSWGHAVSKDLLHWEELPVAVPEKDGVMIFTGSVVVDHENSSGFCKPKTECLVAIYTGYQEHFPGGTRQAQYVAYSVDRGRTWTNYDKNPVIDLKMADFRDPSVFWDEERHRWVMAVSLPKEHDVQFYSSTNLKQWALLSEFGQLGDTDGDWECPDLLRVPSAQDPTKSTWALKVGLNPGAPQGGSGEQYFFGAFDGKTFTASHEKGAHGWTNYGKDDYCAINFNNIAKDEKPVLLGWMSNWEYAAKLPTSPWRGQMSLPRRLSFVKDVEGLGLKQEPVVETLRDGAATTLTSAPREAPFELQVTFDPKAEQIFGMRIYSDKEHYVEIGFDRKNQQLFMDRTKSSVTVAQEFPGTTVAPLTEGRGFDLHVIVDRSSVEAFAQDGTIAMNNLVFPTKPQVRVETFGSKPTSAQVWKLKSIWK